MTASAATRDADPTSRVAGDRPAASGRVFVGLVVAASVALALAAVWHYDALGLTLSHYDAKAHLVVARRIFDSLTPGWRQIGAIWLPLPHVLNAIPVQVDAWYRSGASGVAISVLSFATAVGALTWLVGRATGSRMAALAAAIVFATDPNVLYLQSTPMTEPLLLGLIALAVACLYAWVSVDGRRSTVAAGAALAAACLTRYEAWPVTVAALALAAFALWRRGVPPRIACARTLRVALYPACAVLGFLVLSRATVGEWFVTGGFYVVDNKAHGRPLAAAAQVWWGLRQLVGTATLLLASLGAVLVAVAGIGWRVRSALLLPLALAGTAALPWYAFLSGHPFRIRYMVVLVAAVAACAGLAVGLLPRRSRLVVGVLAIAVALYEAPAFRSDSPLIAEAQWDRPNGIARRSVTNCLAAKFARPQEKILASMGSLAHYMQELSSSGFALSDFIHEGIGELWPESLAAPWRHVEWILFEEQAEGGDMLTEMRRRSPEFVAGFTRVCEGGGVALYRRDW